MASRLLSDQNGVVGLPAGLTALPRGHAGKQRWRARLQRGERRFRAAGLGACGRDEADEALHLEARASEFSTRSTAATKSSNSTRRARRS